MALRPYYLGDTSALARRPKAEVAKRLNPLLEAGLVARCTITDLESGFSSTSPADHLSGRQRRSVWPFVPMDQQVPDRAVTVQDRLAELSDQRGVKIADLLIAAAGPARFKQRGQPRARSCQRERLWLRA